MLLTAAQSTVPILLLFFVKEVIPNREGRYLGIFTVVKFPNDQCQGSVNYHLYTILKHLQVQAPADLANALHMPIVTCLAVSVMEPVPMVMVFAASFSPLLAQEM